MIYAICDLGGAASPQNDLPISCRALKTAGDQLNAGEVVWSGVLPASPVWSSSQNGVISLPSAYGAPTLTAAQLAVWNALKAGTATSAQVQEAIVFIAQILRADLFT